MKVVLFDGVCNLCNGFVDFLITRDGKKTFKFSSLQSPWTKENLPSEACSNLPPKSILYWREGQLFRGSAAVLWILRDLGFPWTLFFFLMVIPAFIRDFFYRLLARHRYQLYGKKDTCRLPTEEEKATFL